jgi:mannose-6-phosphate isomerase-like protein (cupin superfamily)
MKGRQNTMTQQDFLPYAENMDDYSVKLREKQDDSGAAQLFSLTARLPEKGNTDTILAVSKRSWVVIKTYAEGGENSIHAHPNDEHTFAVLQGCAEFIGPNDERRSAEKYDGVIMPAGTYYRFVSVGEEPLVMLRMGFVTDPEQDPLGRINAEDLDFDAYTPANKSDTLVLSETAIFP